MGPEGGTAPSPADVAAKVQQSAPAAGTDSQPQVEDDVTDQSSAGEEPIRDQKKYDAALKKANAEAAKLRKQVEAFEAEKLTELEKVTKRAEEAERAKAELETKYREATSRQAVIGAAKDSSDPELVWLDMKDRGVEVDPEDSEAVKKAVEEVLERRPALASKVTPGLRDAAQTSAPTGQQDINDLLRAAAGKS